jgi:hypothetical protein
MGGKGAMRDDIAYRWICRGGAPRQDASVLRDLDRPGVTNVPAL